MRAGWCPTAFVAVAAFPQTANGKLDRAALPAPQFGVSDRVAPRTANEAALIEIWSEVLGHHDLGVTDPFEVVGGHSLAAAQVDARIASRLGVAPGRWTTVNGLTVAEQALRPGRVRRARPCRCAPTIAPPDPPRRPPPNAASGCSTR